MYHITYGVSFYLLYICYWGLLPKSTTSRRLHPVRLIRSVFCLSSYGFEKVHSVPKTQPKRPLKENKSFKFPLVQQVAKRTHPPLRKYPHPTPMPGAKLVRDARRVSFTCSIVTVYFSFSVKHYIMSGNRKQKAECGASYFL